MTITSHDLCDALFKYHRYKASSLPPTSIISSPSSKGNLSNTDTTLVQGLHEAKEIIDAADTQLISTLFRIEENQQFLYEVKRNKIPGLATTFGFQEDKDEDEEEDSVPLEANPIHVAAFLGDTEIVEALLKIFPEGSKCFDSQQSLPLAFAVAGGQSGQSSSVDTAKLIIKEYPEAVSTPFSGRTLQGEYAYLPIHEAACYTNLEMIQILLDAYPEGISKQDHVKDLPLHYAAGNPEPCLACIVYLVNKYQDGVKAKGEYGMLPIHRASVQGNLEAAEYLSEIYPDGVEVSDNEFGRLPISFAASNDNLELVKYLYELYPTGAERICDRGLLPIQHCTTYFDNLEIIQFFYDKKPEQIYSITPARANLLHLSTDRGNLESIKFILSKYPSAINKIDEDGDTPMHIAALSGYSTIMKLFLEIYPIGSLERDRRFGILRMLPMLPIDIATKEGHLDTVKIIIEQVLSSPNWLGYQFALELLTHEVNQNDNYPGQFLWDISNCSWKKITDKFGHDALLEMDALRSFPMLPLAIGKISMDEIKFLINSLLRMDLGDMVDNKGQSVMTVTIKEASKSRDQWIVYYKPLLELINSKLHNISAPENFLSSRGDDMNHDILHSAITNGLPWYGLEVICMANEEKLALPDKKSGLCPFMQANGVSLSTVSTDENLVYKILRMKPDVIKMITNEHGYATSNGEGMGADEMIEQSWKRPRLTYD